MNFSILIFISQITFAAAFFFLGMAFGVYRMRKSIDKEVEKATEKYFDSLKNPYV